MPTAAIKYLSHFNRQTFYTFGIIISHDVTSCYCSLGSRVASEPCDVFASFTSGSSWNASSIFECFNITSGDVRITDHKTWCCGSGNTRVSAVTRTGNVLKPGDETNDDLEQWCPKSHPSVDAGFSLESIGSRIWSLLFNHLSSTFNEISSAASAW